MIPVIRRAQVSDAQRVFPLAQELATSFPVEEGGFTTAFLEVLGFDHLYLSVAESSGEVLGYVLGTSHPTFYASGPVAWVEEIFVRKEHRRKGVGRLLMADFERWADSRNSRLVALATRRAADFYQSLGYVESAVYFCKVRKS